MRSPEELLDRPVIQQHQGRVSAVSAEEPLLATDSGSSGFRLHVHLPLKMADGRRRHKHHKRS